MNELLTKEGVQLTGKRIQLINKATNHKKTRHSHSFYQLPNAPIQHQGDCISQDTFNSSPSSPNIHQSILSFCFYRFYASIP